MASAKRKQDEKNLKVLRELVSQPCNKECFDCRQRGPTYVNMTIGSFVCTSCSGVLRGLTPPHRVKSISMATFTQEEINFIKQRGNKHCERIWLGLLNPGGSLTMDTKDEQKMKDLMHIKYELRRYYLEPTAIDVTQSDMKKPDSSTKSNASRISLSSGISSNDNDSKNINEFTTNFVADFSKITDFSIADCENKLTNTGISQPTFANFDNNPAFITPKSTLDIQAPIYSNTGRSYALNVNEADAPPEDRYAALKDLDSLMKQTKLNEETAMNTSTWNPSGSNSSIPIILASGLAKIKPAQLSPLDVFLEIPTWQTLLSNSHSIWGIAAPSTHLIANPFSSADLWKPATNIFNNNIHTDNTVSNSANPFKSAQPSVYNETDIVGVESSNIANVIQLSQVRMPVNKVWQSQLPTHHANPFTVHSRTNITNNSNNPFL